MPCCIMCTYAKERRKPQKMSIASSRSRSCSIRNRRAISLQSVVSYNSSSSVPNADIAHYITYDYNALHQHLYIDSASRWRNLCRPSIQVLHRSSHTGIHSQAINENLQQCLFILSLHAHQSDSEVPGLRRHTQHNCQLSRCPSGPTLLPEASI